MLSVAVPGLQLDTVEDSRAKIASIESQPRHRKAAAYLALQPSEQAVLAAASRIFAAYVATGVVTDDNQHELSDRSVKLATRMALVIEKYIQSDDEDWLPHTLRARAARDVRRDHAGHARCPHPLQPAGRVLRVSRGCHRRHLADPHTFAWHGECSLLGWILQGGSS